MESLDRRARCRKTLWDAGLRYKAEARGFCALDIKLEGCLCSPSLTGWVSVAVSPPAQTLVPVGHPGTGAACWGRRGRGLELRWAPPFPVAPSRGRAAPDLRGARVAGAGPGTSGARARGESRRAVSGARGARGAGVRPGPPARTPRARREGGGAPAQGRRGRGGAGPPH